MSGPVNPRAWRAAACCAAALALSAVSAPLALASASAPQIGIGEPVQAQGTPISASGGISAPDGPAEPTLVTVDPLATGARAIAGTVQDAPEDAVVLVALRRGPAGRGCSWWLAERARFGVRTVAACSRPRWTRASLGPASGGSARWRLRLGARVLGDAHVVLVQVLDAVGRPVDVTTEAGR